MSHNPQKQDMHGRRSKKKWVQDHLASVKDIFKKPGSRTPLPSPHSALEGPSATIITDVPIASSQGPSGVPVISPQGPAMVISNEGISYTPNIPKGTNVSSGTAEQARGGPGISWASDAVLSEIVPRETYSTKSGYFYGSKARDRHRTAWHGLQILLGQVEGLLDETPFKVPVVAVNMLIQLGNVVNNNHETLRKLMTSIKIQVETIGEALISKDVADTVTTKMKKEFARILLEDFIKLYKLENYRLWQDALENEQEISSQDHAWY